MKQREIKFRVWDGKKFLRHTDAIVDREYVSLKLEGGVLPKYGCEGYHKNMVIQQWTGAIDQNGTLIYDGDLLEEYRNGYSCEIPQIYKVVWYGYEWNLFREDEYLEFNLYDFTEFKVIGNIFES